MEASKKEHDMIVDRAGMSSQFPGNFIYISIFTITYVSMILPHCHFNNVSKSRINFVVDLGSLHRNCENKNKTE